ncbi:MAG: RNA polymerase sigma factor [Terriglobia bacterium]
MGPAEAASHEQPILRARAQGQLSSQAAYERLYALYAPAVLGWLMVRVDPADADDLFQDVWMIFYRRWQRWQFLPEMWAPEARPVLSFLFRTCHLTLQGQRRRRALRQHASLDGLEVEDGLRGAGELLRRVEFGRALELARRLCPPAELDVLLAKLAGVPARESARTLGITEAVVDHRFRNAVARLRERLRTGKRKGSARKRGARKKHG